MLGTLCPDSNRQYFCLLMPASVAIDLAEIVCRCFISIDFRSSKSVIAGTLSFPVAIYRIMSHMVNRVLLAHFCDNDQKVLQYARQPLLYSCWHSGSKG